MFSGSRFLALYSLRTFPYQLPHLGMAESSSSDTFKIKYLSFRHFLRGFISQTPHNNKLLPVQCKMVRSLLPNCAIFYAKMAKISIPTAIFIVFSEVYEAQAEIMTHKITTPNLHLPNRGLTSLAEQGSPAMHQVWHLVYTLWVQSCTMFGAFYLEFWAFDSLNNQGVANNVNIC